MTDEEKDKRKTRILILVSIGLMLLLFELAWIFIPILYPPGAEGLTPGTFGDMFGSINALFSGAALIGVIIAVYLQSKELGLQRIEMRNTVREMENQTCIIKKQLETMNKTYALQHKAAAKESAPQLKLYVKKAYEKEVHFGIENCGGTAKGLAVKSSAGFSPKEPTKRNLNRNEECALEVKSTNDSNFHFPCHLTIGYKDSADLDCIQSFEYKNRSVGEIYEHLDP